MEIDPGQLTHAERHRIMIGGIVPRPIAFVSTIDQAGRTNLAPFSFYNGVASTPMTLLFCPANNRDGTEKDTLRNAKPRQEGGRGEFVVNVAVERYRTQVAAAGEPLPAGQSEFDLTGLTPAPAIAVAPPRVAESPLALECRTLHVVRLDPGAPHGGNVVIGEVVHIYCDDAVMDAAYNIDPDRLGALGRMAGQTYVTTRDRFEMPPGAAALRR
jgi:flavin reductase (DIM6/NTAB) family NADH-FMN oxidoreductase RutF